MRPQPRPVRAESGPPAHVLAAATSGAVRSEACGPAAPERMRTLRGRSDVPPAAPRPPGLGSEIAGRMGEGWEGPRAGLSRAAWGLVFCRGTGVDAGVLGTGSGGSDLPRDPHATDRLLAGQEEEVTLQPDRWRPCTSVPCRSGILRGGSKGEGPPGQTPTSVRSAQHVSLITALQRRHSPTSSAGEETEAQSRGQLPRCAAHRK